MAVHKKLGDGREGFALLLALLLVMAASALVVTITRAGSDALTDAAAMGSALADRRIAMNTLAVAERRLATVEAGNMPLADISNFSLRFPESDVVVRITTETHRANANHASLVLLASAAGSGGRAAAAAIEAWRGSSERSAFWSFSDLALATGLDPVATRQFADRLTLDDFGAGDVAGLSYPPAENHPFLPGGTGRVYRIAMEISGKRSAPAYFLAVIRATGRTEQPWLVHRLDRI